MEFPFGIPPVGLAPAISGAAPSAAPVASPALWLCANSTGDPVFDDTLKQAVSIGLQQSPRVRILPDQKIKETLGLMERSPDEPLNEATAREICQRNGSSALLAGSISSLGSQYVLGLKAVNCGNGDVLVLEQSQAARKEDVLRALDPMVTNLRSKLGESLASVQKFDTPLEQATTPSLEALKAYSLGVKAVIARSPMAGIPLVNRAIEPGRLSFFKMSPLRKASSNRKMNFSPLPATNYAHPLLPSRALQKSCK